MRWRAPSRSGEAFDKAFGDSDHPAAYVYTRCPSRRRCVFARACSAWAWASPRIPATGSAAAAFAGALMQCEPLGDGEHDIVIEQGVEMGRPSEIDLQMVIKSGALVSAEIGGNAVMVSRGESALIRARCGHHARVERRRAAQR